jgi:hypothetical protein
MVDIFGKGNKMMSDEELDLFIDRMKKDLREDFSESASVCPRCGQVLSKAAAEHSRNHNSRKLNLVS